MRLPACTTSASWSCTCTLRTAARAPPGTTTRPSPTLISPDHSVPVTTVPMPLSGNTLSTGRRAGPAWRPVSARSAARCSAASRSSRPRPSLALTVTSSQPANGVPSRNPRTSSSASSSSSSSTRSALVSATTPSRTPSSSMMARCSRVCGITPSSAAMTSRKRSTPVAPATMVRTKRSWPGTSTTLSRAPDGSSSSA